MEELQLKYVEIAFDKQKPQRVGTQINISTKIDKQVGILEYKFIVGKGGVWRTIQEFSEKNECIWKPKREGEYMVMVQAREKDGKKPLDYLAKEDYSIIRGEVISTMNEDLSDEKAVNADDISVNYKTIEEKNIIVLNTKQPNCNNNDFKGVISNKEDGSVKFECKDLSVEEVDILVGNAEVVREIAFCKTVEAIDNEKSKISKSDLKELDIIQEIIVDSNYIVVGDKCTIQVNTNESNSYLYRYYVKKNKEWDLVKDYDISNVLKYTANEAGEKEFLIQCKKPESIENFEDYKIVKISVKDIPKVEITNFKCLNKLLVVGEELKFVVETNNASNQNLNNNTLLFKFYKIYKDGKSTCIQDYSTKNIVSYKESEYGDYRILCLLKSILSNKEYDDRAILVYNVKPYRDVRINNFVADLNSPQASETDIKFTSEVEGGNNLLYRFCVKGTIGEDTGYTEKSEFTWRPMEAGEYEVIMFVKDSVYKGEYEDSKKIAFTIEKRGKKPIKILDVVVDREKKIIVGEPVNIIVNGEGGTRLQYAFVIRKDKRKLESKDYSKTNWINFIPMQAGEYELEIMLKDRYSNKNYDIHTFVYLKAMEYLPGEIDYIILPYKETHLIGDVIEFECIIQNTQNVLVKYETKINGNSVEKTEFSKNKKLRFIPKTQGKYTIEVYAKNLKCTDEYDSKKEISLHVNEASPVIDTKISINKEEGNINQELTFEVTSRGGKDVCYEFYLMENGEWRKVQGYSRKNYYSFIPFIKGKYKILALAKSYYKKVSYEDYDEISFYVKE